MILHLIFKHFHSSLKTCCTIEELHTVFEKWAIYKAAYGKLRIFFTKWSSTGGLDIHLAKNLVTQSHSVHLYRWQYLFSSTTRARLSTSREPLACHGFSSTKSRINNTLSCPGTYGNTSTIRL